MMVQCYGTIGYKILSRLKYNYEYFIRTIYINSIGAKISGRL